jgi:hypothetical protein
MISMAQAPAHVPGSVIAGLLKIDLAMSASSTINGGTQIDWERVQPVGKSLHEGEAVLQLGHLT